MSERTVYLGVVKTDELYLVGPKERQVSVPWCVTCDKPACTTCDGPPHHYRDSPCVIKDGVVWKVADDE